MTMSPAAMSLRGRIGAHTLHATRDPRQTTSNARQAFLKRFEDQVDPEGTLSPEERAQRAQHCAEGPHGEAGVEVGADQKAKSRKQRGINSEMAAPIPQKIGRPSQ